MRGEAASDSSGELAGTRRLLRHTLATLAYRAEKVLRDFPPEYARSRVSPSTRTPLELVSHLGDLMEWAVRLAQDEYRWQADPQVEWNAANERFFRSLAELDDALVSSKFLVHPADQIFQGPIADALTHVGQLALVRGMLGPPVRPESYARADIRVGAVGRRQAPPRKEFDGDASHSR
jgi:hypothetical protein